MLKPPILKHHIPEHSIHGLDMDDDFVLSLPREIISHDAPPRNVTSTHAASYALA